MMRFRLVPLAVLFCLALGGVRVDAGTIYSVTDLGTADAEANYLDKLNAADQATFRAGSFEQYAHPAPAGLPRNWVMGDVARTDWLNGVWYDNVSFVSGNNLGNAVGVSTHHIPSYNSYSTEVALFHSNPHVLRVSGDQPGEVVDVPSPGTLRTFSPSPLSGFWGTVSGVNDHNLIVGTLKNTYDFSKTTPILMNSLQGGIKPFELGSLGGERGGGNALNNLGQVVGWSELANGASRAFIYDEGIMEDLNALIPPTSGLTLENAVGIDEQGRIVAFGTDGSGEVHEYLLTPNTVPEPTTAAFFGLVLGGLVWQRSRRRRTASAA